MRQSLKLWHVDNMACHIKIDCARDLIFNHSYAVNSNSIPPVSEYAQGAMLILVQTVQTGVGHRRHARVSVQATEMKIVHVRPLHRCQGMNHAA